MRCDATQRTAVHPAQPLAQPAELTVRCAFALHARHSAWLVGQSIICAGARLCAEAAHRQLLFALTHCVAHTHTDMIRWVTVRGSCPLFWEQKPQGTMDFKPKVKILRCVTALQITLPSAAQLATHNLQHTAHDGQHE